MKTKFELHIKNMVCERCIVYVRQVLTQLDAVPLKVDLGHIIFSSSCSSILPLLEQKLNEVGLYIVHDAADVTVEEIKLQVGKYLEELEEGNKVGRLSAFLADRLAKNYYGLTKLFSKTENRTIESFAIEQKIERVKQLIREGELTLSEISYRLGYSNVQHVSSQFRKNVGVSVSEYKATCSFNELSDCNTQEEKRVQAKRARKSPEYGSTYPRIASREFRLALR